MGGRTMSAQPAASASRKDATPEKSKGGKRMKGRSPQQDDQPKADNKKTRTEGAERQLDFKTARSVESEER